MKRVAIIAPCILPVPATLGGAVETLLTRVLDENEISSEYTIDLFTINDYSLCNYSYSHTNIFPINTNKKLQVADRISDKVYRTLGGSVSARRRLDDSIIKEFKRRYLQLLSKGESYEAVIVENLMSTARAVIELRQIGFSSPVFFHIHNNIDIYRSPEDTRYLVKNGVEFLAVSEAIKNQILEASPDARVEVLYNGIDFEEFNPEKFPVNDGNVTEYLYIGRVIPEKGVLELVLAYKEFLKADETRNKSTRLKIVGFSDNPTTYEKKVLNLCRDFASNIITLEKQPSELVPKLMAESHVVVMPTIGNEPFGLVALEAIAMGKPLIVTKAGGVEEIVDENCSIIIEQENLVDNIKSALVQLLDESLRKTLAGAGFEKARANADFNILNYTKNFFRSLAPIKGEELISVIIPVYNVEKYAEKCIKSVTTQTYSRLEIIVVDDGSTDSSEEIIKKLAEHDPRITYIRQENQGVSATRNKGLELAKGEYIYFLDGDDWIEPQTLETMLKKLHSDKADIVAAGFCRVYADTNKVEAATSQIPGSFSGSEAVVQSLTTNNVCTVVWGKLYKRKIFEDLRFPVGKVHEDEGTIYKALYRARKVTYMPECFYNYLQRKGSIMNDGSTSKNKDYIELAKERIAFFQDKEEALYNISLAEALDHLKYCYRTYTTRPEKSFVVEEYKKIIHEEGYPKGVGLKKKLSLICWKYLHF